MHRFLFLAPMCLLLSVPARAADKQPPATSPQDGTISLFNSRNLEGLYTWLEDTKYEDPREVFSVRDSVLQISGDGLGYICTKQAYRDYHLVVEFKWGQRTWGGRKEKARDSGVLVHCVGPDGNRGAWMASLEFQMIEGGTGDIILLSGGKYEDGSTVPVALTCEVTKDRDGENVWKPGGERTVFTKGRINWFGRDPDWKDTLNFRGPHDLEKPVGQWNRLECICRAGHIQNYVNGVLANEGFDAFPAAGKIMIQAEGAELFVRKWELQPLKPAK